jgi:hypothetical protein
MEKKETIEKMIIECLKDFDFEKVHRVMAYLGWRWPQDDGEMKVPSVAQIVIEAMWQLREVAKYYGDGKRHSVSSGGLKATMGGEYLTLEFVLDEAEVRARDVEETALESAGTTAQESEESEEERGRTAQRCGGESEGTNVSESVASELS